MSTKILYYYKEQAVVASVFFFALASSYTVTEDEVTFYLRARDNGELQIKNDTLSNIDCTKNFTFIIHGWKDSHNETYIVDMTAALLESEDLNVILVDWSKPAAVKDHDLAANNTKGAGASYFSKTTNTLN